MELAGSAWREGDHHGTLVGSHGLELIPGVSRGRWEHTLDASRPFSRLVASLNPEPWPVGAGVRLSVRVRSGGSWSTWASLGIYGSGGGLPRSEQGPSVNVDVLETVAPADGVMLRLEVEAGELGGTPRVRRLALTTWTPDALPPEPEARGAVWGTVLDVPERSQRVESTELADRVCSPTSLGMLLEFWGHPKPTAQVARAVYDHGAKVYGNWSFNVAYAAEHGLSASVAHLSSLADLELEIAAGRPVVISHRYSEGELSASPLPSTTGHLIVVVGFDAEGRVVVNDPAAAKGEVRRVYAREELRRTWLGNGQGIAYLISAS
jgi:hypothetical protein